MARVPGDYVEGRRERDLSIRGAGKEYTQILFGGRHLADASRVQAKGRPQAAERRRDHAE